MNLSQNLKWRGSPPTPSNLRTPWSACGGHGWWTKRRFIPLTSRTLRDSGYVALFAPEIQTRYAMAHHEHKMTNSRSICHGQQRTRCWRGRRFCSIVRRALALTTRRCHAQSEVPDRCGAGKACEKCVQRQLIRGTDRSLRIGPRKNQHCHWRSVSLHQLGAALATLAHLSRDGLGGTF